MKAWDKLPGYAGKVTDLRAWLTRLVHNLCLDIYRERQRRTKTVQNLDEMVVANEAALAQVLESPEEAVLRRELYVYIQHAINDLPPRRVIRRSFAFSMRCLTPRSRNTSLYLLRTFASAYKRHVSFYASG